MILRIGNCDQVNGQHASGWYAGQIGDMIRTLNWQAPLHATCARQERTGRGRVNGMYVLKGSFDYSALEADLQIQRVLCIFLER